MDEIIKRINELSKIAKERKLTSEESEERKDLREKYLDNFRNNFVKELKNVKIVDEEGNDVTPIKLKLEKEKG